MIQLIKHRCNRTEDLNDCDPLWGAEIDLRSDVQNPHDLHLSHDPFHKGESFRNWLAAFGHKKITGPVILNTKEDGLEKLITQILASSGLKNEFIFLDTTLPTLRKWTREQKKKNFFVRWSSIEPLELAEAQAGFCDWAWIDCFDRITPDKAVVQKLSLLFKTCLVSPELQGGGPSDIERFAPLTHQGLTSICTKFPAEWANHL